MARRYALDTKIHALNMLDKHDGDIYQVFKELNIPTPTLSRWRGQERDLRKTYRIKLSREFERLKSELQVKMLERGLAIVEQMDDETIQTAPLNQLASALSALVNHALKLEEAIQVTDEQEEKVYRIEYLYDGSVHKTPPWATNSSDDSRPIQSGSVWEAMGQNRAREDHSTGVCSSRGDTRLVAGSDLPDVESGLARLEDDSQQRDWYHD